MMRALGIIASLAAGLSAAHAAEGDDLVSVFKSVCMTSGSFKESVREFSQARNLKVTFIPSETTSLPSRPLPIKPRIVRGAEIMPRRIITEARSSGAPTVGAALSYTIEVYIGRLEAGQVFDSCEVSYRGLTLDGIGARVETLLELPASQSLSAELRKVVAPFTSAGHWSLSADGWDHIVAYERSYGRSGTSLIRLRSSQ